MEASNKSAKHTMRLTRGRKNSTEAEHNGAKAGGPTHINIQKAGQQESNYAASDFPPEILIIGDGNAP